MPTRFFSRPVPEALAERLLRCLGLRGLDDGRMFTRDDLVRGRAVERATAEVLPELVACYVPCRIAPFVARLDETLLLTLTRHVLREHGRCVLSRERTIDGRKRVLYRVAGLGEAELGARWEPGRAVRFD